jgi:hypothetical protein
MLVDGKTQTGRALHIVVGINKDEKILYIITTYEPDAQKWINNKVRRIK